MKAPASLGLPIHQVARMMKAAKSHAHRAVTEAQLEKLGQLIDRIDNLVHAAAIPMPDKLRVTALAEALPDLLSEFRGLYVEIAGANPWEHRGNARRLDRRSVVAQALFEVIGNNVNMQISGQAALFGDSGTFVPSTVPW